MLDSIGADADAPRRRPSQMVSKRAEVDVGGPLREEPLGQASPIAAECLEAASATAKLQSMNAPSCNRSREVFTPPVLLSKHRNRGMPPQRRFNADGGVGLLSELVSSRGPLR
jgi:hypothetical protein